jgi:hypothetical protein
MLSGKTNNNSLYPTIIRQSNKIIHEKLQNMQGASGLKQDNWVICVSAHADTLIFFKNKNVLICTDKRYAAQGLIYLAESLMPLALRKIYELNRIIDNGLSYIYYKK